MLLVVLIALFAVAVSAVAYEVRARRGATPANLGWMSVQWLAEYRASHGA